MGLGLLMLTGALPGRRPPGAGGAGHAPAAAGPLNDRPEGRAGSASQERPPAAAAARAAARSLRDVAGPGDLHEDREGVGAPVMSGHAC